MDFMLSNTTELCDPVTNHNYTYVRWIRIGFGTCVYTPLEQSLFSVSLLSHTLNSWILHGFEFNFHTLIKNRTVLHLDMGFLPDAVCFFLPFCKFSFLDRQIWKTVSTQDVSGVSPFFLIFWGIGDSLNFFGGILAQFVPNFSFFSLNHFQTNHHTTDHWRLVHLHGHNLDK